MPEGSRPGMGPGINLIGRLGDAVGPGSDARGTLELLAGKGWQVAALDPGAGGVLPDWEERFRNLCVTAADRLPHGINLWHMNPPETVLARRHARPAIAWERFNVCIPSWELAVLPDAWIPILEAMDLILAPTRFLEGVIATQAPGARVRAHRHPLRLPEAPRLGREAFGLPERGCLFVAACDFGGDPSRQGPMDAVRAFQRAFHGRADVHLALQWVNHGRDAGTRRAAEALALEASGTPNVRILERELSHPELLSLVRSADAAVSLHRAQGPELGEWLALGVPVVATAWSGVMDFLGETNSCPVAYRLERIPPGSGYARELGAKEAWWAGPDLDDAAAWMRALAEDRGLRDRLAARAREDMRAYDEEARRGIAFDDLRALRESGQESLAAEGSREPETFAFRPGLSAGAPPSNSTGTHPSTTDGIPASNSEGTHTGTPAGASWRPVPEPAADRSALDLALAKLRDIALGRPGRRSRVTAVVSTYNSELFFRGCLQNLVEQTLFAHGRLEVVVVDSGSGQGEGAIAREFQARHPGIVYLRTERETLYAAWNRAAQAATGDYLVNANTDDRNPPHAFERMAEALDASPAGLVYGDALLTERENETWAAHTASRLWSLPDFNVRQGLADCPFGCVVMWRRALHGELGYFDPAFRIAGDYEFFLKASMARGALHLKEPLSLYYESQKNLSYGNQSLVDEEVERFLAPVRAATPLAAIYPFLAEDPSPLARAAAAMDLAALFLNPLARVAPKLAIARLTEVLREAGPVPTLLNNIAVGFMLLGMDDKARETIQGILAADPGQAAVLGLGTPEGHWIPKRIFQPDHPGLRAMPPVVYAAHTRTPLAARAGGLATGARA